jgi:hypothetical protein
MSVLVRDGTTKRDWVKLAGAAAETAFKSLTLGKDGFSAAIGPLFRFFEAIRGNDSTERRASRLVLETLAYAITKTVSSIKLVRPPGEPELKTIIEHLLARTETLAEQNEIRLSAAHLKNPNSFSLFVDVGSHVYHELKPNQPKTSELELIAVFHTAIAEGLNRVRTRTPEYYAPLFGALAGPDEISDVRTQAWQKYRSLLARRFEDEPLFGEDHAGGVTLGQVYQNLWGSWEEDEDDAIKREAETEAINRRKATRHLGMLEKMILDWLAADHKSDRVRLISGGPGSGKSTFARRLAALLSSEQRWRVVLVPLQRLRGSGPLEQRIDEYFRLQGDEPFDAEVGPLNAIKNDGHRDWLIIFDGLDELAKEGVGSESSAQEFASIILGSMLDQWFPLSKIL